MDRTWPLHAEELKAHDLVKKQFNSSRESAGEGMWVRVRSVHTWGIVGVLVNSPKEPYVPPLEEGAIVSVNLFEILDWVREPS